jgi:recombination protein RecA
MNIDLTRQKEFDKVLNKKFGTLYTGFGQKDNFEPVQRVPLDCVSLNSVLGGGLPVGRVVEIYGANSVGKSALSSHIIASYQKQDKFCMLVDVEHAFDPEFASYCGVDLDKLCMFAPNSAEEALDAMRTSMKLKDKETGEPILSLVILDSVAALTPAAEFEDKKEIGSTQIGSLARLMSNALKQLVAIAAENKITIILINQERATNIGGYGPKSTTAGGNAVKYYCSIRLDLNRTGWLEEGKQKVGQIINIETTKNKTATPFKSTDINLLFPTNRKGKTIAGVDVFADIINLALSNDIIEQAGAWYKWGEEKFQGFAKVMDYFMENDDKYQEVREQVLNLNKEDGNNKET